MPPQRKSSRRAFLQGRTAAEALGDAAQALPAGGTVAPASPETVAPQTYLLRIGRRAMACEFEVLLNAGQYADGTELAVAALDLVDRLEDQLTVFRDQSEVSRLNRTAFEREVVVEPRLFELLRFAQAIHRRTAGAYDITSGPLSKVWGFYRRAGQMPRDEELAAAVERIGAHHLVFDDARRTIRFLRPEIEINLGSIARGSRGLAAGEGWWVGLRNPLRPEQQVGEIRLRNRALATSGSGKQFFFHEGRRYGHILDPRTGRPAVGMLSTTVLAPTAAAADALSTAFFVMGIEAAQDYCRAQPGLGAVLIAPGPKVGALDIRTFGLDETDWRNC
jgi:thiamine biosynthesis lipoprotein